MTTPRVQRRWPESRVVITSSEMITDREFAQLPEGYQRFSSGTRSRTDARDVRGSSAAPVDSRETMDGPVGVNDILKTLSDRSRRGRRKDEQAVYQYGSRQADAEEVLRPFWGPSGREGRIDKQAVYQYGSRQADAEEVLRPFWGPSGSRRSVDERIERQDTLRPSVSPVAPRAMGNPLGEAEAGRIEWIFQDGKWVPVQITPPKPMEDEPEAGHVEWVFKNGKWIPVQVAPPERKEPVIRLEPEEQLVGPFRERAVPDSRRPEAAETRLIKIPADKLLAGDPRYNIVIKPGDTIYVPVDIIGEFCIMGNVNRTGFIPITGRPMTLKMAIAAAGGLGPLAWPKRCEVVRRIGRKREEIVRVDLDKIASGEQPDFFIKPNDLINVGTHATARWRAVLRNAYRATYGFGFVYDRNFADRDFGTRRLIPSLLF
ncbi:MAG: SLBB domain-containing protein [Planctomycetota bacterium]